MSGSPADALEENFFYNSMLARALIQLISAKERSIARVWLNRLHEMGETPTEIQVRNEYMWFMLLMLQNKTIQPPFNKVPPSGNLRPLSEILSPDVYEDVLMATDQNMSWLEKVASKTEKCQDASVSATPPVHPAEFLTNQPIPQNGIICYFAAFSDHDY